MKFLFVLVLVTFPGIAGADINITRFSDCSEMEVFDVGMQMCTPFPMKGMPMKMLMVHGNSFFSEVGETGPRGRSAFAIPDFFMADLGTSVGDHNYVNLDYMGTLELWTFPYSGYPELLQIGEETNQGVPYLDAQHPHSSPVMGLTLSDTINFDHEKDYLKIFMAPRGAATDGPIAFMHRPTGIVNPDAPLGHHIGQDVGHITSSVIGESLKVFDTHLEFSTYHGAEPQPQNVDLPIGTLDSYSLRLIEEFSPTFMTMASFAYVTNPEVNTPSVAFENRYSASVYNFIPISEEWSFDNTLIWGSVSNYDDAATLTSFAEEFLFLNHISKIWGRLEVLQRTPAELQIQTSADENIGQWVTALTLGYTHQIAKWESAEMGLGGSITTDVIPQDYQRAYGGNPWSGIVFVQVGGMKMWNL